MMKKLLSSLFLALFIINPLLSLSPVTAQAATVNSLIKGSGSTIYWYASNGKRYVFPNTKTFYSWFSTQDFSRVQTMGDNELYLIPLAGNVTYRPGAKLVKVTTDPRVYAVSRYGVLRWVTSEYLAQTLYGSNWRQWVEDVPDAFFTNYTVGSAIYSASDYNVSNEYNQVQTPSDNISAAYIGTYNNTYPYSSYYPYSSGNGFDSNTSLTGTISRRTNEGANEVIDYTAILSNTNTSNQGLTIQIYNERTGQQIWNCSGTTSCTVTLSSSVAQNPILFARAVDQQGHTIESLHINVYYGTGYNGNYSYPNTGLTGTLTLNADRTSVQNGDSIRLTAYTSNLSNASQYLTINIYDSRDDRRVKTCTYNYSCTTDPISLYSNSNNNTIVRFYAIASNDRGEQLPRVYSPEITVLGNNTFSANTSIGLTNLNQYQDGSANVQITVYVSHIQGNSGNVSAVIYDERDNAAISTFTNCVPSCSANAYVTVKPGTNNTFRYYAILRDQYGNQLPTVYSNSITAQQVVNPPISNYGANLSLMPNYYNFPQNGNPDFVLRATVTNLATSIQGMVINIFEAGSQTPLATCLSSTECTYRIAAPHPTNKITKQYFATLLDAQGNLVSRQNSNDVTFSP